jgi:hypothetical protein
VQLFVRTVKKLQFTDSVMNSPALFFIATVYTVIGEPPSAGTTQAMVTLVFEFSEVVGAAGTLGFAAAITFTSDESAPYPTELSAATLK